MSEKCTDITAIYCTAGKIPEHFAKNIHDNLVKALREIPLLDMYKDPDVPSSIGNYYRTLLLACEMATTPYVAICEDDTLYTDDHFRYFRPPLDTFAYNFTRWNIYPWSEPPFYSLRQREILATGIFPRELFIEAIKAKFKADPKCKKLEWWGEPGRNHYENMLGVPLNKSCTFETYNPQIVFSHKDSFCYETLGMKKLAGKIRALELPYFGKASDIIKLYKEQ